ncbi:MAG TPA: isoleucine--tRNA ligase [Bacillota bacterium]|nr:isoleucine--tRNA ligase [Bacillota bacterium]
MFTRVPARIDYPEMEERVLTFWREHRIFERSVAERAGAPPFVFYEGPPTANGLPHIGHIIPRTLKDLIPRYQTMRGRQVIRKAGWDTHGLPVELEVEKALGLSGKEDIERFGVERFIEECKKSVFTYEREWVRLTERIGFWLDLENAYVTYHQDYMESVWWALKEIHQRGLLYQGHRIVPYCPRCGTAVSSHEVALGYAEVDDPSVVVKFAIAGGVPAAFPGTWPSDRPAAFLVWTTTPWTLPSNAGLAVNPEAEYVLVDSDGDCLILAAALAEKVLRPGYRVLATARGREMVGLRYRPPFSFFADHGEDGASAFTVLPGDFVNLDEGTGVVHLAPAFGEDDMRLGAEYGLPVFQPVDARGRFTAEAAPYQGCFVKEADPLIIRDLSLAGLLYGESRHRHTYPFCWRCDSPLLYYARRAWFIRMTAVRDELLANNETINWVPEHLRRGRFGNFLENVVDWCLSRERYWGTPLNIWICRQEGCRTEHAVGSIDELARMAGTPLPDPLDLHRPYIDRIELTCPACGGMMTRVPEVIDCWFDAGAMFFAQWHYPFAGRDTFARQFPADYICEAIDQTRGWFYSLLAISTLLFGQSCYRSVLCTEFGLDDQGQKMSKHKGNVLDPWTVINEQGADALRWFLCASSPPWYPKRFSARVIAEHRGKTIDTLWNVVSFFTTYAELDGFVPGQPIPPAELPPLDRWLLSRLQGVVAGVRLSLDQLEITSGARLLDGFVDDLSNWYVRRGRKRYWKTEADHDKQCAYQTLWETLTTLARLFAPYLPFLAEELYRLLERPARPDGPPSVHLTAYPEVEPDRVDGELEAAMASLREYVSLGRAARNRASVRTRQPLRELILLGPAEEAERLRPLSALLEDELNVRQVGWSADLRDYLTVQLKPRFDRLGPRLGGLVRGVPAALAGVDAGAVAAALESGRSAVLELGDDRVILEPGDLEVRWEERAGYCVERGPGRSVALNLEVTDDLLLEGLARELVNRIQRLRKEAGFAVEDHIAVAYRAEGDLERAIREHGDYIRREVLAGELAEGDGPDAEYCQELDVDGLRARVALRRRPRG